MMNGNCDRARQWASLDVDRELSTFERVLLANHVAGCPSCQEFRASVDGLTSALRTAPQERFEVVVTGRNRRRVSLRLAPAVAAMAVAAVGLGSILASSEVRSRSVDRIQSATGGPAVETMNVSTSVARANLRTLQAVRRSRTPQRSLRGGPVLREP
jgi:predicted anti-sigma-YlaC factor YlaD